VLGAAVLELVKGVSVLAALGVVLVAGGVLLDGISSVWALIYTA
jgi:hypothetical protein